MNIFQPTLFSAGVLFASTVIASATTFSLDKVITETVDVAGATSRVEYDLSDLGIAGNVQIPANGVAVNEDGEIELPSEKTALPVSFLGASSNIAGKLSAEMVVPSNLAFDGELRVTAGNFAGVSVTLTDSALRSGILAEQFYNLNGDPFNTPSSLEYVLDILEGEGTAIALTISDTVNGAVYHTQLSLEGIMETSAVPVPAASFLLLTGLGGLCYSRKKSKRSVS